MLPKNSTRTMFHRFAFAACLPGAAAMALAVTAADPRPAHADNPVGLVLAAGAVAVVAAGAGAAIYAAGASSNSSTTTTTTTEEGGETTSTTTTTTQSERSTQQAEAPPVPDHEVSGRAFDVDLSLMTSRTKWPKGAIPVFPATRMLQELDVMLSAADVKSVELVTERAITFEVGRAERSRDDAKVEFDLMINADMLKLSTTDIPETKGYSALEVIISEIKAAAPLLHSRIIVQQGERPRFSGADLKFERVKAASDLLILRNVVGQVRASLPAFAKQKQFVMVLRMIGYGERS